MQLPEQIAAAFPKRPVESNKYSVGVVTVVGGSSRYVHAPVIAGLATGYSTFSCLAGLSSSSCRTPHGSRPARSCPRRRLPS